MLNVNTRGIYLNCRSFSLIFLQDVNTNWFNWFYWCILCFQRIFYSWIRLLSSQQYDACCPQEARYCLYGQKIYETNILCCRQLFHNSVDFLGQYFLMELVFNLEPDTLNTSPTIFKYSLSTLWKVVTILHEHCTLDNCQSDIKTVKCFYTY